MGHITRSGIRDRAELGPVGKLSLPVVPAPSHRERHLKTQEPVLEVSRTPDLPCARAYAMSPCQSLSELTSTAHTAGS